MAKHFKTLHPHTHKIYKQPISKDVQHLKYKLRPQCYRATLPLSWLKLRRLTLSSVSENMDQLEPSYTVFENVKWYSHFGKQLGSCL